MSDMQAQCWFMVCPDCGECVESMDIHCDGTMRGANPYAAPKETIYCPAQTYPRTPFEPAEYCENEVANYGDLCPKHDEEDRADADYENYLESLREDQL